MSKLSPKNVRISLFILLTLGLLSACVPIGGNVLPSVSPNILNKKYNEVSFLMTHNAMNNTERGFTVPNQSHSITRQLQNGVRGLMLDTYDGSDGVALTYHGYPAFGNKSWLMLLMK